MPPHVRELAGDRVLVDRDCHAAQRLGRQLRPVEPRAVVADDRQGLVAPEAEGGQPEGEVTHVIVVFPPGVGLPDAAVLLADRGPVPALPRLDLEEPRERCHLIELRHERLPLAPSGHPGRL